MVFTILYLQSRKARIAERTSATFVKTSLLIPLLQFACFSWALYVAITRVTDNKHHPSDAAWGAFLGASVQILNVFAVLKLFSGKAKVSNEDGAKISAIPMISMTAEKDSESKLFTD